jgi:hypothetical protein
MGRTEKATRFYAVRAVLAAALFAAGLFILSVVLSERGNTPFVIDSLLAGTAHRAEIIDGNTMRTLEADPTWEVALPPQQIDTIEIDVDSYDYRAGSDMQNRVIQVYIRENDEETFLYRKHREIHILKTGANFISLDTDDPVSFLRMDFFDNGGNEITVSRIVINPKVRLNKWMIASAFLILLIMLYAAHTCMRRGEAVFFSVTAGILFAAGSLAILKTESRPISWFYLSALTVGFLLFYQLANLTQKDGGSERLYRVLVLLSVFSLAFLWMVLTPFEDAPDEKMRYALITYLAEHKSLPRGDTKEILDPIWGFSYGFMPLLPCIISAVFRNIASLFTTDAGILLRAARMESVLSTVGTAWASMGIADLAFKRKSVRLAFPLLVGLYPVVLFLGTYTNVDSFALFTTALIVLFWLRGSRSGWKRGDMIGLAVSIGLCALSYYNSYGFILMSIFFFLITSIRAGKKKGSIAGSALIIFAIAFLIAGWWFIRNLVLYDGDLFARNFLTKTQELYALDGMKPSQLETLKEAGVSLSYMLFQKGFLLWTYLGFIGVFGRMSLWMLPSIYRGYTIFFIVCLAALLPSVLAGIRSLFRRRVTDGMVIRLHILAAGLIPVILSIMYSYTSDYQPQGRYVMPAFIPFAFFLADGAEKLEVLLDRVLDRLPEKWAGLLKGKAGLLPAVFSVIMIIVIYLHVVLPYDLV